MNERMPTGQQLTVPELRPLTPIMGPKELAGQFQAFEDMKRAILRPEDTYTVAGVPPHIRKSGWRKLALAFNLSDEIEDEIQERDPEDPAAWVWHVRVKVSAQGGRSVIGVASCSSTERKFAHPEHDTHALAHTRAKSRAIADMLAAADLIAEEELVAAGRPEDLRTPAPATSAPSAQISVLEAEAELTRRVRTELVRILGEELTRNVVLASKGTYMVARLRQGTAPAMISDFRTYMVDAGYAVIEAPLGPSVGLDGAPLR